MNEDDRRRSEERCKLEIVHATDLQIVCTMMSVTGTDSEAIEEFRKHAEWDFRKRMDALDRCPKGSLAVWLERVGRR